MSKKTILSGLIFIVSFLFLVQCGDRTKQTQQEFENRRKQLNDIFDTTTVSKITIKITEKQWNAMLNYIDMNMATEEYVKADFIYEKKGETKKLTNIGFRIRGNHFSRRRPEGRKRGVKHSKKAKWNAVHFKISFKEYIKNQRFMGAKRLNLKFFKDDPSYTRSRYCFDLFKQYGVFTAQRSTYTRLYIKVSGDAKPAYFGVYHMMESIDDTFLKARFQNNYNGDLWKCLYGSDFHILRLDKEMGVENINPTNRKLDVKPAYDLKTNKDEFPKAKSRLKKWIAVLNKKKGQELKKWLKTHMNIDLFLRALAVNVLVGMWDDYWVNMNNFYVYLDPSQKLHFIPYDYDNTLGTSMIVKNSGTQNIFKWGQMNGSKPLTTKILAIPEYKKIYANHILTLIKNDNELFGYSASIERIKKWQNMIKKYIPNDTGYGMKIMDKPARWGNAPFYRLLSGDKYGGYSPANYFKTRIFYAKQNLGLAHLKTIKNLEISFKGFKKHPKGYYYTFSKNTKASLQFKTKEKLSKLMIFGAHKKTLKSPPSIYPFKINFTKKKKDHTASKKLFVQAFNKEGAIKKNKFQLFWFDNSYESPEIIGNDVIFRCHYSGKKEVLLLCKNNGWGRKGFFHLKKTGKDMWSFRTNKTAIAKGMYLFLVKEKKHRWFTDYANTNVSLKRNGLSVYDY